MAIMDRKNVFSDAQALGAITDGNSVPSTDKSDLGANGTDGWENALTTRIGQGGRLVCNITIAAALVGAGATIIAKLMTKAADATIETNGTELGRVVIPALAAVGNRYVIPVPPGDVQRHIGVLYTADGANLTSATVNAWIGLSNAVNVDIANG